MPGIFPREKNSGKRADAKHRDEKGPNHLDLRSDADENRTIDSAQSIQIVVQLRRILCSVMSEIKS